MVALWIIQQCRNNWNKGLKEELSWKDIDDLTENAESKNIFIDVDDNSFEREIFDMPGRIIDYCKNTSQKVPAGVGDMCVVVYESLALKYLVNLKKLEKIAEKKIELIHFVGGGSNNKLLCQWIADATGLLVLAGPAETTITGNLLAQMVSKNVVKNIDEAREIVINSIDIKSYIP